MLSWDLLPTLRPHISQITLDVHFGLQQKQSNRTHRSAKLIEDYQFPALLSILAVLLQRFESTIERHYGHDVAPLTIDDLVTNISRPGYCLEELGFHGSENSDVQPISKYHPSYKHLIHSIHKQLNAAKDLFSTGDEQQCPGTCARIRRAEAVVDGEICWERDYLVRCNGRETPDSDFVEV